MSRPLTLPAPEPGLPTTVADRVYQALRSQIGSGELEPGDEDAVGVVRVDEDLAEPPPVAALRQARGRRRGA